MKKDIDIPEVTDVYVAAVREKHKEYGSFDWNVYVINDLPETIEGVLIVSKGYGDKRETSTMRHSITQLPPRSFAKVEFLQEEVLQLNNEFSVSFFAEGKMFHKKFTFKKNSINERALQDVPVMQKKGVLLK